MDFFRMSRRLSSVIDFLAIVGIELNAIDHTIIALAVNVKKDAIPVNMP